MNNLIISVFRNQILLGLLKDLKLFSKYKIEFCQDLNLFFEHSAKKKQIIIFFEQDLSREDYNRIVNNDFPLIIIRKSFIKKNETSGQFIEKINKPFSIFDLEKKVVSLLARYEFVQSSVISLDDYIIDKNERKMRKNKLELQLKEKEINFLILFSKKNKPMTRDFLLKNLWKYSPESDTHTIETHIHRLRKKIMDKFGDKNFIKNNKRGYYI